MNPPLILSRRQKRALSLTLVLAATVYLSFVIIGGYETLLSAAGALGWQGWLFILSCSFVNYLLRFVRWHIFMQHLGHKLPRWLHFNYYLAGFALTTTPAKAGETIRSLYLKSHGVNVSHSLACFFCERFLDVVMVTLLASLAILNFGEYGRYVFFAGIVLILALPTLRSPWLHKGLAKLAEKIHQEKISRTLHHTAVLLHSAHRLLQTRLLYLGLFFGLLAWSIQGVAFYFILMTIGAELSLTDAFAIYAISLLAGALSFIPGGIGATEAVMSLLLIQAGLDTPHALAIPLISRLSTLWFAVCLGLMSNSYLSVTGPASKSTELP